MLHGAGIDVALQPPHWHMRAAHASRYSEYSAVPAPRRCADSANARARTKSEISQATSYFFFDSTRRLSFTASTFGRAELALRGYQGDDGSEENHDRAEPDPANQGFHEDLTVVLSSSVTPAKTMYRSS
jgi:hypothetical protein